MYYCCTRRASTRVGITQRMYSSRSIAASYRWRGPFCFFKLVTRSVYERWQKYTTVVRVCMYRYMIRLYVHIVPSTASSPAARAYLFWDKISCVVKIATASIFRAPEEKPLGGMSCRLLHARAGSLRILGPLLWKRRAATP